MCAMIKCTKIIFYNTNFYLYIYIYANRERELRRKILRTSILTVSMIRYVLQWKRHHMLDITLFMELAERNVLSRRRRRQLRSTFLFASSPHAAHVSRDLGLLQDYGIGFLNDRWHETVTRGGHGFTRQRFRAPVALQPSYRFAILGRFVRDALTPRRVRTACMFHMRRCYRRCR